MVASLKNRGPAPVHLWDPPFCGDIDMMIKRDGTWVHEGKPIRRMAMVQLFASVLKREAEDYFLVTPVEKVGIQVEDCPFLIVEMDVEHEQGRQVLRFATNTGETVIAGSEHALKITEFGANNEPHPTIHVRGSMPGLLSRAVFYRLVELAELQPNAHDQSLGVFSNGVFFPLSE